MSLRTFVSFAGGGFLLAFWMLNPPVASGQSAEGDTGEVSVLGGVGLRSGTQPAVSGSAGTAISRYGIVMINTSFMPLGKQTIQPWPDHSTVDRSYLLDFGVDFHIRVPIGERWAPYGIAGTGLLWNMIRQHTVDSFGRPLVVHYDQFNGALHTGGGLRYYVRPDWGIRSEVKVIVSRNTYTQVLIGVFHVTPSNWP